MSIYLMHQGINKINSDQQAYTQSSLLKVYAFLFA